MSKKYSRNRTNSQIEPKHIILFFILAFVWLFIWVLVNSHNDCEIVTPGFEGLEVLKCRNSNGESMDYPDSACHLYGKPENLSVGDVVIIDKGNRTVIHRLVEIEDLDNITYYTAKGDNNGYLDDPITLENISYKVLKTIYFGE